jgi:tetratricopeptide (TPR) repeat protein
MNAFLQKPSQRWSVFLFTLLVSSTICVASGHAWYADHLAQSSQSGDWLRAAQLEPGNGEYWYKLGFNGQFDLDHSDPNQEIKYLQRAVALDPRSADYLMELAGAYESAGQSSLAREAYHTALADYPASAVAHFRFGSFLLRQDDTRQAYSELHFALQADPRLIPLTVSRVWPATHDAEALVKDVLPDTLDAQQQALEIFSTDNELDPALAVWKHMVASGHTIPIATVFPLEGILLQADRGDDARDTWRQALIASGNPGEAQTGDSLIFNGGFEYDSTNGGLDWNLRATPGVNFDYDSANAHSGKRALRLTFDGEQNIGFETVFQIVPVHPNTSYHFQGFLKTTGVTTESGIQFFISLPGAPSPLMLDNFTGDHPWQMQSADFTTSASAHQIVVELYRAKSVRFNNKLAGTAWVDDVSIVPAGSPHPNP